MDLHCLASELDPGAVASIARSVVSNYTAHLYLAKLRGSWTVKLLVPCPGRRKVPFLRVRPRDPYGE